MKVGRLRRLRVDLRQLLHLSHRQVNRWPEFTIGSTFEIASVRFDDEEARSCEDLANRGTPVAVNQFQLVERPEQRLRIQESGLIGRDFHRNAPFIASTIRTVSTLTVVTRFSSSITRSLWSARR